MLYNVNELVKSYRKDSQANSKRKPTNDLIIDMLLNSGLDSVNVNPTKSLQVANRGEVVEVAIKKIIFDYLELDKESKLSACKCLDLDLRKINNTELLNDLELKNSCYEIKLCSSLANATIKRNNCKKVLIVNLVASYGLGVYLVDSEKLIVNDSKHIKAESVKNGYKLELLSELLLG